MLSPSSYKPITGTFLSCLPGDTGISNMGKLEWENEFAIYQAIGIDTIIVIRSELECNGTYTSALDPRSTTWEEDPNLLSMFFRLCDQHNMDLYLGGAVSLDNLYKGYWQKEISDNIKFYEKMLEKFSHRKSFQGLYFSIEALPWHFNFFDIVAGIAKEAKKLAPEKKKLLSPTLFGLTGYMNSTYSVEDFTKLYGNMLNHISGCLDYCAWQDKYFTPECRMGQIIDSKLEEWLKAAKRITEDSGAEFWVNIETFQRGSVLPEKRDYRQIDYRCLAAKLQAASRYSSKNITFELSSCMSPYSEWGSSLRLLQRYLEMTGLDSQVPLKIIMENTK